MKIVSAAEMRLLEQEADAAGYTYAQMMETAGLRVAEVGQELLRERGDRGCVVVLVGPGNNGGDGLVAARHLTLAGHAVHLYLSRPRPEADPQWQAVTTLGIPSVVGDGDQELESLRSRLDQASLVIDALLGTGATPPVRGAVAAMFAAYKDWHTAARERAPLLQWPCRARRAMRVPTVLAVDLPSGMDADSGQVDELTPVADVTVTLGAPKLGHFVFPGAERVGRLVVADIGLQSPSAGPEDVELLTPSLVASQLPPRPRNGHKGTFGSVLVVAGSANYVGAAVLAAAGAARTGCGLVTLAGVSPVVAAADAVVPEATRLHLPGEMGVVGPEAAPLLRREWSRYQVLLLGPGLTQEKPAAEFVARLLGGHDGSARGAIGFLRSASPGGKGEASAGDMPPLVVDADGLNLLAKEPRMLAALPPGSILTPHPGEMARLLGCDAADVQANRLETARAAARKWGVVVVLKGAFTVIAAPDGRASLAPFANPALASAGTGDVLAGAIASLVAQGLDSYAAACAGVFLHGFAGELAAVSAGKAGVLATDLLGNLPQARAALQG